MPRGRAGRCLLTRHSTTSRCNCDCSSRATLLPQGGQRIAKQALYEERYCGRGDMENRIKEQQLWLFADRTSAATMRANQLRLYFSAFAGILMTILRRAGLQGNRARQRPFRQPSARG